MGFKSLFSKKAPKASIHTPAITDTQNIEPADKPSDVGNIGPKSDAKLNVNIPLDVGSVASSKVGGDAKITGNAPKVQTNNTMPELKRPSIEPYLPQPGRTFPAPVIKEAYKPATPWPKYSRPLPSKDVFAFIVENSNDVLQYKDMIVNVLNNIIKNKTNAIFVFVRVGNGKKSFVPMDYDDLAHHNIIPSLFSEDEPKEQVNLSPALYYIRNIMKVFNEEDFSFKHQKYKLNNFSIICVGSSSFVDGEYVKKSVSTCIRELKAMPKLKAFKYFCLKDSDAVKIASFGFPVIGHLVSNFYS